jgi:hypothetical protein
MRGGDEIAMPIQLNGVGPVEHQRATITALDDDEPNGCIRMAVHLHSLGQDGVQDVKPGDLVHRLTDVEESRYPVFVRAPELWKWAGALIDDPDGGGDKVRIVGCVRGPHPEDGHEILAMVVEDRAGQRRPVFMEMTGGMFCEGD